MSLELPAGSTQGPLLKLVVERQSSHNPLAMRVAVSGTERR